MIDDQTVPTREAIGLMANNAVLGLLLVLVTTWLFLGTRIAIFTALGIPVALAALVTMFAVAAVASGMVRMDFFAADTLRLFYVNVEMPPATPLEDTLAKTHEIEAKVRARLEPGEARAIATYAGNMFTETEPRLGDQFSEVTRMLRGGNPGSHRLSGRGSARRRIADPGAVQPGGLRRNRGMAGPRRPEERSLSGQREGPDPRSAQV